MEGLQFDNEELRHETEFLRNKVATFYHEASMRADGGHNNGGGGEGMRQETPPSQSNSLDSRDGGMAAPLSPSGSTSSFASCDGAS